MNNYHIFLDKRKSCATIIEIHNRRLFSIHEVNSYPLLGDCGIKELSYPTRKQLHSKRSYIMNHNEQVCVLINSDLQTAVDRAHTILREVSLYESIHITQPCH